MFKQYFAAPDASASYFAGIERVFSAAGKMHTNLKKSAKDTTLEQPLAFRRIQHRLILINSPRQPY